MCLFLNNLYRVNGNEQVGTKQKLEVLYDVWSIV